MPNLLNPFSQSRVWWVIALLWFTAWHFFITWSTWSDPTRLVPGPIGDNTVMLWNLGWVKYALDNGSSGFWFTNAYYPDGFLFLYGTHTWLDGLFYWLFSPLLPAGVEGTVLWANITMVIATVASGLLIISSLRAWGIHNWPVLIMASSCAAFSWFRMFAQGGHYHFMGTHWMLVSLCFLSWGRYKIIGGNARTAYLYLVAGGLALGVAFLNDQTMVVFAAILGGLTIITMPAENVWNKIRQSVWAGILYYGSSLVTASIHLVPVIKALATDRLKIRVDADVPRLVDATSTVFPPDYHLLGPTLGGLRERFGLFWSEGTYIGLLQLLLLLLVTAVSFRAAFRLKCEMPGPLKVCAFATCLAWGFVVLALGDKLVIGREQLFTLPGRLLKEIPVLTNIRLPQRWVWPAQLCIALASASALNYYIRTVRRKWLAWIPAILAIIPPLEGRSFNPPQPPLDMRSFPILEPMPVVQAVKDRYTSGSVLTMPLTQAYSRGNILQLLWGFDIPLTFSYTAKMPYLVHETPVGDEVWSVADADWLREKKVTIVVFPLYDEDPVRMQAWIEMARKALPDLIILNRHGKDI